jgi:hypothetical protein
MQLKVIDVCAVCFSYLKIGKELGKWFYTDSIELCQFEQTLRSTSPSQLFSDTAVSEVLKRTALKLL